MDVGLDVLANNAGIMDPAPQQDITLEQWHRIVDINFWGVVYGCHAFAPPQGGRERAVGNDEGRRRLMPETIYRTFAWTYANRKWRFKDA